MLISYAYADTALGAIKSNLMTFLPLILMFAVLYFVILRPQMRRQKEIKAMLSSLAVGDEVVTSGGLLGKLAKLTEHYVVLELGPGVEVKIQRSAVTALLPKATLKSI
jgi:preprotein translocase subunit YajC